MPPRSRRSARQAARQRGQDDDIPAVYHEMLVEVAEEEKAAAARPTSSKRKPIHKTPPPRRAEAKNNLDSEMLTDEQGGEPSSRPSKRRKTNEEQSGKIELDFDLFGGPATTEPEEERSSTLQHVTLTEFDTSTESEAEFEDVDLEPTAEELEPDYEDKPEGTPLELDLSTAAIAPKRVAPRRKPVTAAERKLRLAVHKTHIVMLLAHLKCRNEWCNSESIHAILKPLVPRKFTSMLHVDDRKTQYERNQSFMKGIEEVCNIWKSLWTIEGRGMTRAFWKDDVDPIKESEDAEDLDFDDFRTAAISKRGSRDLAAQLLCTLLRSVAVDARLVCSLQLLPFSSVAKGQTPQKPKPEYIYAPPQEYNSTNEAKERRTTYVESQFPIFWVEAFAPAIQTWIPLDPVVRQTINKPKTGFEPFGNDVSNRLTCVMAFEDDGSAKDVTRRYTQFFNSKIRKQRVESTPGGTKWWDKTMSLLEKPFAEPRDDIEDAYLQKRTESEPMPNNIEDFRGHSVYVLERHLRKNEVIHPRREAGKVSIGVAKNAKLVSVFRRRDVHICRTADAWYRRGRDVDEGEQPLKRGVAKRTQLANEFDDDEEAAEGTALYAEFQTSLYEPPPAVDGKVPRNAYGNLDVYVPSMIPAGAVHIRHPLASKAARVLGVDYAEAVTGFQFKGRQGTAVVDGVVVSVAMTTAMISVIEGLESQASDEAQEARSRAILTLWKRWITALRIKAHVQRQYGDWEADPKGKARQADDSDEDTTFRPEDDGGGFMLDGDELEPTNDDDPTMPTPSKLPDLRPLELPDEVVHQEIIIVRSPHKLRQSLLEVRPDQGGVLDRKGAHAAKVTDALPEEEAGGGFVAEDADDGGGFLPEDDDGVGGGFLPEDEDAGADSSRQEIATDAEPIHSMSNPPVSEEIESSATKPSVPDNTDLPDTVDMGHEEAEPDQTDGGNEESPASVQTPNSLLSHDPDEEDAEPEWLLNSLGEMD